MNRLWKSSKFWMVVFNFVTSTTVFFVGKYAQVAAEDVAFLIGAMQPAIVMIIAGIAIEDAAQKRAGS